MYGKQFVRVMYKQLIKLGFKPLKRIGIVKFLICDVGRNRHISISGFNTPNEMSFLCQHSHRDYKKITDLVCIHNYDFDGYLTKKKITAIVNALKEN